MCIIDGESEQENDKSENEVICSSEDSENPSNYASNEQPGPSGFSSKEIPQKCEPCDDKERTLGIYYVLHSQHNNILSINDGRRGMIYIFMSFENRFSLQIESLYNTVTSARGAQQVHWVHKGALSGIMQSSCALSAWGT